MTSVKDNKAIKKEVARFLRNQDIFTITVRSVATTTATGTFASATSHTLNVTNIKNIRSIVVGATTLVYGTDYEYDEDYFDTTIKCKITFVAAQTGDYTITYDYGTDKIFPDLPQDTLSIGSFPRIGVEMIGEDSEDSEVTGDAEITTITFAIYVYSADADDIDDYIKTIKEKFIANKKSFYNLRYVRKIRVGPLLPFAGGNKKIFFKSIDYISPLNEETV
jgi:hypothetical protein